MSDYTTRLRELVDDLYGDVARLERQGRALTDAERRRMAALRYAGDLVQSAAELLALSGSGAAEAEPGGEATGEAAPGSIEYGGIIATYSVDVGGDVARDVFRESATGLAGDDDTPGYDRVRGDF